MGKHTKRPPGEPARVAVGAAPAVVPVGSVGSVAADAAPSMAPVAADAAPSMAPVAADAAPSMAPVAAGPAPSMAPVAAGPAPSMAPVAAGPAPSMAPVAAGPAPSVIPMAAGAAPSALLLAEPGAASAQPGVDLPSLEGSVPDDVPTHDAPQELSAGADLIGRFAGDLDAHLTSSVVDAREPAPTSAKPDGHAPGQFTGTLDVGHPHADPDGTPALGPVAAVRLPPEPLQAFHGQLSLDELTTLAPHPDTTHLDTTAELAPVPAQSPHPTVQALGHHLPTNRWAVPADGWTVPPVAVTPA
ncbi:hypothetical protein [Amycolatopsis jiangsuensis]|uniref:Uncharacterized protein n=1 Tax=Amycolatopsis jiangsuensis TaxID=1181879 RepID=A0A840J1Y3_9PSEU|nr:hypothetical protein [Amycolatopsis jiangsuensis]MBB4687432.1 hypothetical protein [Amycolatopsis jiangsuensis]